MTKTAKLTRYVSTSNEDLVAATCCCLEVDVLLSGRRFDGSQHQPLRRVERVVIDAFDKAIIVPDEALADD